MLSWKRERVSRPWLVVSFACVTPLGIGVGIGVGSATSPMVALVLEGLAAGTFIYIGRAVQVGTIKPVLKPPTWFLRLKLKYDELLSSLLSVSTCAAIHWSHRDRRGRVRDLGGGVQQAARQGLTLVPISAQLEHFFPPYYPTPLMSVSWSCSS